MRFLQLLIEKAGLLNYREVLKSEENAVFLNKQHEKDWEREWGFVKEDLEYIRHCSIIHLN